MRRIGVKGFFVILSFVAALLAGSLVLLEAAQLPYVDKPKVRMSIAAGGQDYGVLIMENPTPDARIMKVYLEDWYYAPEGDGSKQFVPAGTIVRSCASWITFSPAEFTIPAFGRQRINYSVKVPADKKGGYFTTMFFETMLSKVTSKDETEAQSAGINLAVRVATLFYVETKDTVKRTAEFKGLSLNKGDPKGLAIELEMENTGNTDITCSGIYHIIDKGGKIFARGAFEKVYTMSSDKVKLRSLWKDKIPSGSYDMVFTFDLGKGLEETGSGRGPIVTKEYEFEIDADGNAGKVTEPGKKNQ